MPGTGAFLHTLLIGMPGIGELLIILLIVLLIFGANKLPQIGEALGRSIKNFRRSTTGDDEIEVGKRDQLADRQQGELSEASSNNHVAHSGADEAEVIPATRKAAK